MFLATHLRNDLIVGQPVVLCIVVYMYDRFSRISGYKVDRSLTF